MMIVVEYIKLRDHVRLDEANVVFSKASISLEDCIDVCTRYRVSTYFRLALVRLSKTVGYGGLVFPELVKERRPGGKRGRRGRDHCEVQDNLTKKYGLTEEIYQNFYILQ